MSFLPSVIRAEYQGGFQIRLTFNDNSERTVDFRQWLDGPVFEPLKDPKYFQRFFLDGGTVSWPNGADIAPETLYEAAVRENQSTKRSRQAKQRVSAAACTTAKRSSRAS